MAAKRRLFSGQIHLAATGALTTEGTVDRALDAIALAHLGIVLSLVSTVPLTAGGGRWGIVRPLPQPRTPDPP